MIMIFGDNGIENNRYGYSADGTMIIIMMIVIKRMEMLIIMTLVIIMILLDNFD